MPPYIRGTQYLIVTGIAQHHKLVLVHAEAATTARPVHTRHRGALHHTLRAASGQGEQMYITKGRRVIPVREMCAMTHAFMHFQ